MNNDPPKSEPHLATMIGDKAERNLRARREKGTGAWFGLGMMGLIGWSVTVPTLLGAALGGWLDRHHPASHPWTLALLMAGLVIGCWNAWHWIAKEDKAIHEEKEDPDE
ncbi:MAG: AtpZ/AtpI family protein [Verrucomicrobiales bacterium]